MPGFPANTQVIPVFERPESTEVFMAELQIFADGHGENDINDNGVDWSKCIS